MKARTLLSRPLPLASLVVIAVVADQIVKWLVETNLPFHQIIDVIPFIGLYRTYNTGVAFSFLTGSSIWALIVLTLCVVCFVLYLWHRTADDRWLTHLGYALIVGGALGNVIDRAVLGHVVDYVLVHTATWSFAVFNLADSFITVGALAVIVDEVVLMRVSGRKDWR